MSMSSFPPNSSDGLIFVKGRAKDGHFLDKNMGKDGRNSSFCDFVVYL